MRNQDQGAGGRGPLVRSNSDLPIYPDLESLSVPKTPIKSKYSKIPKIRLSWKGWKMIELMNPMTFRVQNQKLFIQSSEVQAASSLSTPLAKTWKMFRQLLIARTRSRIKAKKSMKECQTRWISKIWPSNSTTLVELFVILWHANNALLQFIQV